MVALFEHVEDRAAQLGVVIKEAMESVGFEAVGQLLGTCKIVDADKAVVGHGKADPMGGELACQPGMAVAVELELEGAPGRDPEITQTQRGIEEVEVVVQAFAGGGAEKRLVR